MTIFHTKRVILLFQCVDWFYTVQICWLSLIWLNNNGTVRYRWRKWWSKHVTLSMDYFAGRYGHVWPFLIVSGLFALFWCLSFCIFIFYWCVLRSFQISNIRIELSFLNTCQPSFRQIIHQWVLASKWFFGTYWMSVGIKFECSIINISSFSFRSVGFGVLDVLNAYVIFKPWIFKPCLVWHKKAVIIWWRIMSDRLICLIRSRIEGGLFCCRLVNLIKTQ